MSKTIRKIFEIIKYFDFEEVKNLLNYGLTFKEILRCYEDAVNGVV
ncbi:hypothetical protein [Clostridium butyricum]|uniref:Uncharacterized protein n=1 Tax=Clostridium butyricum E4 str. BoNT E BL5262 TaxID=632245 RepID=C4IGU1_CLOBU|nr:hypothetical protein [Clostridium butyricum]EDT74725.1 hypothetical protein CBY_2573 [Clostridium butyricum 5521]EEP53819.1 hypothetical protein CLP_2635 [Clostridium butyricum E4 str. BoNT E BL5262]